MGRQASFSVCPFPFSLPRGIVPGATRVERGMSLLTAFVLAQAIVGGQGGNSVASSQLNGYYNARREVTFSGTVTGKTKGQAPGYAQGMSILVKSGKNIREVELGPAWYVGRQSSMINMGDKLKVTATPLRVGRGNVFLARQIVRGKSVLALRDRAGNPYWSPRRVATRGASGGSGVRMANQGTMYQGTVGDATTFMVNGEEYAGYVVNTPNGPVNVAMAPTWYWNQQPTYFNSGQNITLYGNRASNRVGNQSIAGGVILVNSANYGGGDLFLRPGGFPVYGGFNNGSGRSTSLGGGGNTVVGP